ncbi:hypothetical protein LZ023_37565 (plasmid) [Pseudomonas silvicola]|nr:hypothetical protein LZ023_37565 [Pseudomonas silvicola]
MLTGRHKGWAFDAAALRLNITLPLSALKRTPRGYIPPEQWDGGMTALFLRHNTNYTDGKQRGCLPLSIFVERNYRRH